MLSDMGTNVYMDKIVNDCYHAFAENELQKAYYSYCCDHTLDSIPTKQFDEVSARAKLCMCPYSKVIHKYIPAQGCFRDIIISCGQCYYCQHRKQNELIYRIWNHAKTYKYKLFVTLTYNNQHLGLECHMRDDYQRFLKRLRKQSGAKTMTYYETCERGKKSGRLHHHMLLFWNDDISYALMKFCINECWKDNPRVFDHYDRNLCLEAANRRKRTTRSSIGFTYFGEVNERTITYCTKYTLKENKNLTVLHAWSINLGMHIVDVDTDLKRKLLTLSFQSYQPDPTGKWYRVSTPAYYKRKLLTIVERAKMFDDYISSDYYEAKIKFLRNPDNQVMMMELKDKYDELTNRLQNVRDSLNPKLI